VPPATAAVSDRTTIRIHPERAAFDELAPILADGLVAHVGIIDQGVPVVIPMSYYFDRRQPDTIYIHGAHHSRLMQVVAAGETFCVTVTRVDGLVYSRTARYQSINYRSAVCFGRGQAVTDREESRRVGDAMIARYFPGRTAGHHYDPIPDAHLDATSFVAFRISEASAKVRRGGPKGPRDGDAEAPGTAGVLVFDPPA
jgi:uncharacterized protein